MFLAVTPCIVISKDFFFLFQMESLKVHLQELYLVLEEPPDLVHSLLQSNYFLGNHSDILELKGIFECMEDPNIFATWFRNSKVCSLL